MATGITIVANQAPAGGTSDIQRVSIVDAPDVTNEDTRKVLSVASASPLRLEWVARPSGLPDRHRLASDFEGDNLGAKINAAIADLDDENGADSEGVIHVPPGATWNITERPNSGFSKNKTIILGAGRYVCADSTYGTFVFADGCRIIGSGNATVIVEKNASGQQAKAVFRDAGAAAGGVTPSDNDGVSDVYIGDFQIEGAAPDFDSAVPTIGIGNSHRVYVERVFLNGTCSIGINAGGTSNTGNHATDVSVRDCSFYHVASQNLSAVNCRRFKFNDNFFHAAGQEGGPGTTYIDIEPNTGTDICESFEVNGNIIDAIGSANLGNGILIQSGNGARVGPGTVANNTIRGGVFGTDETSTNYMSNGIGVNGGVRGLKITGNYVERVGQCGIALSTGDDPPTYCLIATNKLLQCGGGGVEALRVGGMHNTVRDNTLEFYSGDESGSCGNQIVEEVTGDYNLIFRNEINHFYAAIGLVIVRGANSREFDNTFDGVKARMFALEGSISDNTLVKRGTTAGSAKQFTTSDMAGDVLGVCLGTEDVTYHVAVVCTDRWNTRFKVKSDLTANIPIGSDIEPSTTIDGYVKAGSTNKIGANEGALVPTTADAMCTAVLQ